MSPLIPAVLGLFYARGLARIIRPAMAADEELLPTLARFLSANMPLAERLEVTGLHRATQGVSRENWPFELSWTEGGRRHERSLLLRRDPVGSVLETDRRVEFQVLKALGKTGVLAPRVLLLDESGESLGRPAIVMERLNGVCDYFVLTGGTMGLAETRRRELAVELCDTLADIHDVDWRGLGLDAVFHSEEPPGASRELQWWQRYLARQELEPQPEMAEVACWLRRNAPEPQRVVLVHGDYKPGNVLLTEAGKIEAVVDWEIAHIGDPMEDLGWVTNPYRIREHTIPGVWEVEDMMGHYAARTGLSVDPDELRYWQVFTNFKLAAIVLTGIRSTCEQRADRVFSYRMVRGFLRRLLQLVPES